MKIAFDIDMTLVNDLGQPIYEQIELMKYFYSLGWDIIVWSVGGLAYSRSICDKLGFFNLYEVRVAEKWSEGVDIAVDDMDPPSLVGVSFLVLVKVGVKNG